MEEAGFVDVVEVIYKWPIGRWPANKKMKEIGTSSGLFSHYSIPTYYSFTSMHLNRVGLYRIPWICRHTYTVWRRLIFLFWVQGLWSHEATDSSLSGLSTAIFTHGLGWSTQELEVFLADVRKDMKNSKIHSYWPM